jgi:deazaflavin-dependent oxidoreductase (nitroreductase family)
MTTQPADRAPGTNTRAWLSEGAKADFAYLTTTGRRSGRPHTIEIWFAVEGDRLYMMAGGRRSSDWVRNIEQTPAVELRLVNESAEQRTGRGRVIDAATEPELDAKVRRLLAGKYQGWSEGKPLSEWAQTALPVEVRFD